MRSVIVILLAFLLFTYGAKAEPISDNKISSVAADPQWHALLHYDASFPLKRLSSRAHASDFFIATSGDRDPLAELHATLEAFKRDSPFNDDHPICRFPARFEWLSEKIESVRALQKPPCERLTQWRAALNPSSVTVIFASSFLNNPASAFGHTFIRLDQPGQTEETRLLAYAADFAASTQGESALVYAAKGVFGGYSGYYSISPYYQKITKYSDLENRDIWEYHLNLTPQEIKLLTLHLWELREKPFSYYYFDENCSYHILALLHVARPSARLIDPLRLTVLPVDTVRVLTAAEKLVVDAVFRPSAATKLRERISHAKPESREQALRIVKEHLPLSALSEEEDRAEILDLAYDYLVYERIRERKDEASDRSLAWELLKERAQLPQRVEISPRKLPARPEKGHRTAMASMGAGRVRGDWRGELLLRPTFHALTDQPEGYLPGAQIKFFETAIAYSEEKDLTLERLTLLNITSLTPRDLFFHPLSWEVSLKGERIKTHAHDPFVSSLEVGLGRSYQLGADSLMYGLLMSDVEAARSYDKGFSVGIGPKAGILYNPESWYGVELSGSALRYALGDSHNGRSFTFSQRFSMAPEHALRIDLSDQRQFVTNDRRAMLRWEVFFTP